MRFVVLADVHTGLPHTQFAGQDFTFTPELLRAAIPVIQGEQPDEIVICGDLVNMGVPDEFDLVNQLLLPIAADLRVVPGNHDLVRCTAENFPASVRGGTLNDIHDRGSFVRVLLNTAVHLPGDLGLYQWFGELRPESIATIDKAIAVASGRPMLFFMHHPPANTVRTLHEPMMSIFNSHELLDRLLPLKQQVVLFCGHNHLPDMVRIRNLTVVSVPALAFWPHAFLVVEVEDGEMSVDQVQVIEDYADSPHARSRDDADYRSKCEPTMEQFMLRLTGAR
jgi:3',5'-cyclic AMP phosphodiesterase CpdA